MQGKIFDLRGLKLLVVDDETEIREILSMALSRKGAEVLLASDGCEGWEKFLAHSDSIDAVISDIRMPGMTGIELMKRIKLANPSIPVMLITGYAVYDFKHDKNQIPAIPDGYLEKPFRMKKLMETLEEMLEKRLVKTG